VKIRPVRGWKLFAMAVALSVCCAADAKNVVPVAIPADDFHDPLYVDADSIRWKGDVVTFKYVLDVPILGSGGGTVTAPRFRSNEIEAVIDCAAQTISILELITYSGRAATGDMGFGFVSNAEERRPERIDMRKGSTSGYLYRHLCKRR
jgi:hypothetical protein